MKEDEKSKVGERKEESGFKIPDAFRKEYEATLREQLEKLPELWESGQLSDVRFITHKIRGNAGIFGYAEMGKWAGEIEDAIIDGLPLDGELFLKNAARYLSEIGKI